jgi:hypothetical protein
MKYAIRWGDKRDRSPVALLLSRLSPHHIRFLKQISPDTASSCEDDLSKFLNQRGDKSAKRKKEKLLSLLAPRHPRACYELGRKSHRNADFTVGLVPSRSLFPAFLSCF